MCRYILPPPSDTITPGNFCQWRLVSKTKSYQAFKAKDHPQGQGLGFQGQGQTSLAPTYRIQDMQNQVTEISSGVLNMVALYSILFLIYFMALCSFAVTVLAPSHDDGRVLPKDLFLKQKSIAQFAITINSNVCPHTRVPNTLMRESYA